MNRDPESERVVEVGRLESKPRAGPRAPAPRAGGDEPTLSDLVWLLLGARRLILTVAAITVALAIVYVVLAQPMYTASALLQIDDQPRVLAELERLPRAADTETPTDEVVETIRSRSLLGPVVQELGLDVTARARALPLIGSAIARRYSGPWLVPPLPGFGGYAWGGERIRVERLGVSPDLTGAALRLTVSGEGAFLLYGPGGALLARGEVGHEATGTSGEAHVELLVSELRARSGTSFTIVKQPLDDAIDSLEARLRVTEKGRRTGIVAIELEGADPALAASTVNAVADKYLRSTIERRSAAAAAALASIETQLPAVQSRLGAAERELNAYRLERGTVDLSLETKGMLERAAGMEKELSDLELQHSELRQRFAEEHPAMAALSRRIEKLLAQRRSLAARMRSVPKTELDSARLGRELKVASELDELLRSKAQELRIVKSSAVGSVRILDRASAPARPTRPKLVLILVLSLPIGLAAGLGAALGRRALAGGVDDPDELERGTGIPVYAAVPFSSKQEEIDRRMDRSGSEPAILAEVDPGDGAIEGLRGLRTSLLATQLEAPGGVIAVTGPGPGEGKSFVAVNLACMLASADRRVILVDTDLRRGRLHAHFGVQPIPGLSDVASGAELLTGAIRRTTISNLDLLPMGRIPRNPAELLASRRLERLLGELSRCYEVVVLDTAPILAVADAAIVAQYAGVTILVVKAGAHSIHEVRLAVKRFRQGAVGIRCAVMNGMKGAIGRYGSYGRYRRYEHRSMRPG